MKNIHVTHCCITNKAQNTYFHEHTTNDFITYTHQQIVADKCEANQIINIDQTNVDFDEISSITLCKAGTRLVDGKICGHSGRATVMLAMNMSGQKLPAFVIWKGVPNGWIARECSRPLCPHNNIKCKVQAREWLDSNTFKQWVKEFLGPNLNGRGGYLLQHSFSVHTKEEKAIVEVDFISAGYTPCLQVLNKGIQRTFKHSTSIKKTC
jgi:hypothetical protein